MSSVSIRRMALAAVLALSTVSLAACGSDTPAADRGGVATLGNTGETSTTATDNAPATDSADAPTDPNEAYVLYDRCMADHGFPTDATHAVGDGPTTISSGSISVSGSDSSDDGGSRTIAVGPGGNEIPPEDIEAFMAANEACQSHLANIVQGQDLTPDQEAAMADANLRMQQCMNDKGFDVQFSISAGGGGTAVATQRVEADNSKPPVSQPTEPDAFQAAMQECSKVFDDYPELADIAVPGLD